MKKKDLNILRKKDTAELLRSIEEKRTELILAKAHIKVGKEKNLKKAKNLRHEIAQLNTLARQKSIIEEESGKGKVSK